MNKEKEVTLIKNPTDVSTYKVFGHEYEAFKNPQNNEVIFRVFGNLDKTKQRIAANEKVGILDIINAIKAVRSLMWTLK